MTERPILFSAPMVRALLAGTKTQTRRVVKPQPEIDNYGLIRLRGMGGYAAPRVAAAVAASVGFAPYGQPGDRLWVKETFAPCTARIRAGHFHYRADGAVGHRVSTNGGESWWSQTGHTLGLSAKDLQGVWVGAPERWRPSIFMTRAASRITLEVTGVRVERLQAISEADARAEGIVRVGLPNDSKPLWQVGHEMHESAVGAYSSLWESINGADSWTSNPWVWVVEFKSLTVPAPSKP